MKLAPSIITCCAIWLVLIILVNIINVINKLCLVIIMSFFFLFLIIIISFFLPFLVIVMYFFTITGCFYFPPLVLINVWHCKSCQSFCFLLPRKKKTLWRGGAGGYKEKAEPSPNDWCLTVNVSSFNCIIPPHEN